MKKLNKKQMNIIYIIISLLFLLLGGMYIFRQYRNNDDIAPEFSMDTDQIECSIDASREDMIAGVTAIDNKDGDISDHIMISKISLKDTPNIQEIDEDGEEIAEDTQDGKKEFEITYVVFDSSNNMSIAKRTLVYSDYHPPRFQLEEELKFTYNKNVDPLQLITAEDCIDGDISAQIILSSEDGEMDLTSYGNYPCTAKVVNSLGDSSEIPLTIQIVDTSSENEEYRPRITLKEYIVYRARGKKFKPTKYLDKLYMENGCYELLFYDDVVEELQKDLGGTEYSVEDMIREMNYGYYNSRKGYMFMDKSKIHIESNVNEDVPGVYTVKYSYKHPDKDVEGSAKLIVVVE